MNRRDAEKLGDPRMQALVVQLDDTDFVDDFPVFARKTMQTYRETNQELYKFILKMQIIDNDCVSLATELIMDALNLSVKKLHVEFFYPSSDESSEDESSESSEDECSEDECSEDDSSEDDSSEDESPEDETLVTDEYEEESVKEDKIPKLFVLPARVFESNSLEDLWATNCKISQPITVRRGTCLPLVSLNLVYVSVKNGMMSDILSRCPLIEYLNIFECKGLTRISLGKMQRNLKHCALEFIDAFVDFFAQGPTQFPKLTSLVFNDLKLEKTFFHNSIAKFPCLTEIAFYNCYGFDEEVEISSPSLKVLHVEWFLTTKLAIDVPNLRTFLYRGDVQLSPLYICSTSKEWEFSDIELHCNDDLSRCWFLRLQELLQNIRVSKTSIHLCLDYFGTKDPCINKFVEQDSSVPVENLIFERNSLSLPAFSDLVNGLFCICRPNFLVLKCHPPRQPMPVLELLRKSATELANWRHDLKQVTSELLFEEDETLKEWRPIIWEDLISSTDLENVVQIRLKLAWHED